MLQNLKKEHTVLSNEVKGITTDSFPLEVFNSIQVLGKCEPTLTIGARS